MSLKTIVERDIRQSMLNKDKDRLRALRAIKSLILLAETGEGRRGSTLSEQEELTLLTKAAKQRKEAIRVFEQQRRDDLVATEKSELHVIESFLPKPLSEEDIEREIKKIIEVTGAVGRKDMGKVMSASTQKLAGKADGKIIADIAKKLLN